MTTTLRIERKNELPSTLQPSTMYVVKDPVDSSMVEVYYTGKNENEVRRIVTRSDVMGMISNTLTATNTVHIVADITARDAYGLTLEANALVMVLDATDDATVDTGAAMYIYDNGLKVWYKIAEYESMDVVLEWDAIQNRPTSTVLDIDDAVARRHSHTNKTELDKIGEDGDGLLTYDGDNIRAFIDESEW